MSGVARTRLGWSLLLLVAIGAVGGAAYVVLVARAGARSAAVRFRTARVERGEVVEGVAASGTVQPIVLVQVGTQVSGVIEKLFKDFNSPVRAGETIAVLDARRLKAELLQDEAALARARADVLRVKAELTRAEHELERQRSLSERRLTSQAELDIAVAAADALAAQVVVAKAAVRQAVAAVEIDRVNLGYATIVSPIDGVVVSRNVDVGQTVAASLQAPTLFVIANDLTKVQVQASVPEADIASISLVVGGIGIMNIMLVSVTERTREIGLRMAVGARGRDILAQFLVEAVLLSAIGGLAGIALGTGASILVSRLAGWPTLISPATIALAVLFSAAVGVFFGFYPALRASRLDPIEALRYE